jgi:hypothetical protein
VLQSNQVPTTHQLSVHGLLGMKDFMDNDVVEVGVHTHTHTLTPILLCNEITLFDCVQTENTDYDHFEEENSSIVSFQKLQFTQSLTIQYVSLCGDTTAVTDAIGTLKDILSIDGVTVVSVSASSPFCCGEKKFQFLANS